MKQFLVRRLADGTMHTFVASALHGKGGVFDQLLAKNPSRGEQFLIKERLGSDEWKLFEFS